MNFNNSLSSFRFLIQRSLFLIFFLNLSSYITVADGIQISDIELNGQDISAGANHPNNFTLVQLNLSWQNSWRTPAASGLNNWDAAWVFVKYRKSVSGVMGPWEHARLAPSGHIPGLGTQAVLSPELLNPAASFNASTNPVVGVMVYRNQNGSGAFVQNELKLKWNYGQNNINDNDIVEVKVFAVEMVYIPGGAYDLGDGLQTALAGQFTKADSYLPFRVQSEDVITLGGTSLTSLQNNNSAGMETADDFSSAASETLPAEFPKGFQSYYMMKYEISQQQYVDFLNTLSREYQNIRTASDISINTTSVSDRFVMSGTSSVQNRNGIRCNASIHPTEPVEFYCDLNANGTGGEPADGQWLACNFLSWADVATYLDWAGLRPMTELEFEKASRGNLFADSGAYAWGSKNVVAAEALGNAGLNNESITTNLANAAFGDELNGPVRVGAFSKESFGRLGAGAGLFGVMELSGNIAEFCISIGNSQGRSFTGLHGDGLISTFGIANVDNWPSSSAEGVGQRGGSWKDPALLMRTSDRKLMNENPSTRESTFGGRGVRTAGCNLPASKPNDITGTQFAPTFSAINLSTGGADHYLWTLPKEILLLTGQGTEAISAISPGTYEQQPYWDIHVSAVNACGAGPETVFELGLGHLSNFDSAFVFEDHVVYVFDQVGSRHVTVFQNLDSVKVIAVGGGGNGTTNFNWGGAGSGFVEIKNDFSLLSNTLTLQVGNSAQPSFIGDILIAEQGEDVLSNRGGNGGSGGGSAGGSSSFLGGSNGSNGIGGSSPGLGNGYILSDLNEIAPLFSAGLGGTGNTNGAGGGGGIIFNNINMLPTVISSRSRPGNVGVGYGAGCPSRRNCLGAQGIIVIGVKIQ